MQFQDYLRMNLTFHPRPSEYENPTRIPLERDPAPNNPAVRAH